MNKRRLFIAINLPEEVKDKIESGLERFRNDFTNDIRFIAREDWHITLSFLGWQDDENIGPILKAMQETTAHFAPPRVEIFDISYGPKKATPRMIWANGTNDTSDGLSKIKSFLEGELEELNVSFSRESRKFNSHITLARFRGARDLPQIDTDLKQSFAAPTLDLMESHLSRSGAKYALLQRMKFRL